MSTITGNRKIAAARLGIPFSRYQELVGKGRKYCSQCKTWKPTNQFYFNPCRHDRLAAACIPCDKENSKIRYRQLVAKKGRLT